MLVSAIDRDDHNYQFLISLDMNRDFASDPELEVYKRYRDEAFEVQVGLHELTGRGFGKLLQEMAPRVFNFDKDHQPISPLMGELKKMWYGVGQTWGSVFGSSLAGLYEECQAKLVAIYHH